MRAVPRRVWRATVGRALAWLLVDEQHGTDDLMAVADAVREPAPRVPRAR